MSSESPSPQSDIEFDVELYDDNGKMVKKLKKNINEKNMVVDTRNIQNGTYFIHIIDGKEIVKKQIIIQH